ncbi:MAG: hypothetical protein PHQ40_02240 [Anaerolineaceae bacterium]|nr:hypothetical protein [Anaerolineaceae bacterium]
MSKRKAKRYHNRLEVEIIRSEKYANNNTHLMIQITLLRVEKPGGENGGV